MFKKIGYGTLKDYLISFPVNFCILCGRQCRVTDMGVRRGLEPGGRESGVKGGSGSLFRERGHCQCKYNHSPN